MKSTLIYFVTASLVLPAMARAQEIQVNRNAGLKAELQRSNVVTTTTTTAPSLPQNLAVVTVPAQQQQMVVTTTQPSQAESLTALTVEAAPLQESRAEKLRKQREQLETQTEQKIVEKLETDRMQEEQKRSDRIFGDRLDKKEEAPQVAPVLAPQVVVQPVVQASPTPAPTPAVDVKAEVKAAIEEVNASRAAVEAAKPEEKKTKIFVSLMGGAGDYPTVSNVKSKLGAGFGIGAELGKGLVIEADYIYSRFDISRTNTNYYYGYYNPSPSIEMEQNDIQGAIKYRLLEGKLHPVVGGLLGYNYRSYHDKYVLNGLSVSTQTWEVGLLGGVDLDLSDSATVGVELRYMSNLSSDSSSLQKAYGYSTYYASPVEELNYYMFLISGKLTF